MKIMKIDNMIDLFISEKDALRNFSNEKYLYCGNMNRYNYRILVKFNLEKIKKLSSIKNNISKVELCLYLSKLNMEKYMDKCMLNIAVNLEEFYEEETSYEEAPTFYQMCNMFVVSKENQNKYINFDITHIIKQWLEDGKDNYGITILGVMERSLLIFNSSRGDKRAYIKITYNEEIEEISEIDYQEENQRCKRVYGLFINDTGKYCENNIFNVINWNKSILCNGIKLGKSYTDIIVEEKGIYQIDYSVNIRSNKISYMSLVVNGVELPYSRVQVGCQEEMTLGTVLLKVERTNSHLQLVVKKVNMVLANIGVAANIRLIKI